MLLYHQSIKLKHLSNLPNAPKNLWDGTVCNFCAEWIIAQPLTDIVNCSYLGEIFPEDGKLGG